MALEHLAYQGSRSSDSFRLWNVPAVLLAIPDNFVKADVVFCRFMEQVVSDAFKIHGHKLRGPTVEAHRREPATRKSIALGIQKPAGSRPVQRGVRRCVHHSQRAALMIAW
jgi:hypothetical protein